MHEVTIAARSHRLGRPSTPPERSPPRRDLAAPHEAPHRSEVHYAPRGVVGVISPWNFPLVHPDGRRRSRPSSPGNACVVKPSEVTPLIAAQGEGDLTTRTGLPEDLFGVVFGYGPTGQALIEAGIDFCVFTGAVETGRRSPRRAGERLVPCTMELGGKAPLVACEDCDLERTARAIVFGGFANCGQVCISVERVYAHHERLRPAPRARGRAHRASSARATLRARSRRRRRHHLPQADRHRRAAHRRRGGEGRAARAGGQAAAGAGAVLRADRARRLRPLDERDARRDLRPDRADS